MFGKQLIAVAAALVIVGALSVPLLIHAEPSVLYVDGSGGSDEGSCADPALPCKSIAYALENSESGGTINVARGTYYETLTVTDTMRITFHGGLDPATWESCVDMCGGGCYTTLDGSQAPSGARETRPLLKVYRAFAYVDGFKFTNAKEGAIFGFKSFVGLRNSRIEVNYHYWIVGIELNQSGVVIERSVLARNTGVSIMSIAYASSAFIDHSVIVDNECIDQTNCKPGILSPPNATLVITSSVLWGNNKKDVMYYLGPLGGHCSISNTDIEMGCPDDCSCSEIITDNPLFADQENGDYRLTYDSPCRNAGNPDDPLDPDGTQSDIGVCPFDERIPTATPTPTLTPVPTPTITPSPTSTVTPSPTEDMRGKVLYLPYAPQKSALRQ